MKADKKQIDPGKIFIICGPSGSGKTTLLAGLIQDKSVGKLLVKLCTVTTRPRRSGEKQGKDYYFVTAAHFQRLLKAKKILEWTRYLGYYYGTPREGLENELKSGRNIGLCLDLKGAGVLKKVYPQNTVTIFVLPPSLEALKSRIENRCSKVHQKEVAQRMRLARSEMAAVSRFDYCVLNQDFRLALKELKRVFLQEIKG